MKKALFILFLAPAWLAAQSVFLKTTAFPSAPPPAFLLKKPQLPPAFCAADLPFFCRLELKMDKAVRTPVRFRLGSQEYVDWLERKSCARFMDLR